MKENTYKCILASAKAKKRAFWHIAWPRVLPTEVGNTPPAPLQAPLQPPFLPCERPTKQKKEGKHVKSKCWHQPRWAILFLMWGVVPHKIEQEWTQKTT